MRDGGSAGSSANTSQDERLRAVIADFGGNRLNRTAAHCIPTLSSVQQCLADLFGYLDDAHLLADLRGCLFLKCGLQDRFGQELQQPVRPGSSDSQLRSGCHHLPDRSPFRITGLDRGLRSTSSQSTHARHLLGHHVTFLAATPSTLGPVAPFDVAGLGDGLEISGREGR